MNLLVAAAASEPAHSLLTAASQLSNQEKITL